MADGVTGGREQLLCVRLDSRHHQPGRHQIGPSGGALLEKLRRDRGGVVELGKHCLEVVQPPPGGALALVLPPVGELTDAGLMPQLVRRDRPLDDELRDAGAAQIATPGDTDLKQGPRRLCLCHLTSVADRSDGTVMIGRGGVSGGARWAVVRPSGAGGLATRWPFRPLRPSCRPTAVLRPSPGTGGPAGADDTGRPTPRPEAAAAALSGPRRGGVRRAGLRSPLQAAQLVALQISRDRVGTIVVVVVRLGGREKHAGRMAKPPDPPPGVLTNHSDDTTSAVVAVGGLLVALLDVELPEQTFT